MSTKYHAKPGPSRLSTMLQIRMTERQRARYMARAKKVDLTVSDWVRKSLDEACY